MRAKRRIARNDTAKVRAVDGRLEMVRTQKRSSELEALGDLLNDMWQDDR